VSFQTSVPVWKGYIHIDTLHPSGLAIFLLIALCDELISVSRKAAKYRELFLISL